MENWAHRDDHYVDLNELVDRLQTNLERGLTKQGAQAKLKKFGKNEFSVTKKIPWQKKLLQESSGKFGILLTTASVLCFITYALFPAEGSILGLAFVLLFINLITATFTFIQNEAFDSLVKLRKNIIPLQTQVIRDGIQSRILAIDLVPGDIIVLEAGIIPADVRIILGDNFKVDISDLTGESYLVSRSTINTSQNPIETSNLALSGTLCKEGYGRGLVTYTGDRTIKGLITSVQTTYRTNLIPPPPSVLRVQLNRLIKTINIIVPLTVITLCLQAFYKGFNVNQIILYSVGIIVSLLPVSLLGTVAVALSLSEKKLAKQNLQIQNFEIVNTLGMISCIITDKYSLTQNKMTVEHLWYNDNVVLGTNPQVDQNELGFIALHECAIITSDAMFGIELPQEQIMKIQNNQNYSEVQKKQELSDARKGWEIKLNQTKWQDRTTIGDASESGLIRFYQPIQDILFTRNQYKVVRDQNGSPCRKPFNSRDKYAYVIVEYETTHSHYCLFSKGAGEIIWDLCGTILDKGQIVTKGSIWEESFEDVNQVFGKEGERSIGFSKYHLPKDRFPKGYLFDLEQQNFPLNQQNFLGLITFADPIRESVPSAIERCKQAGIKVILVAGDQLVSAGSTARKCNLIWDKTANDLAEEQEISFEEASKVSNAMIIHGDLISKSYMDDENLPEDKQGLQLSEWLSKPQIVFARTAPSQKCAIISACQKMGYLVAATGDSSYHEQSLKQADIGIALGVKGSTTTKDVADIILLDDDFSCIPDGIEEGRRLFDNLQKITAFTMTSNFSQVLPFVATILLGFPLPLTTIFILILEFGTNLVSSTAMIYEESENDIMIRKPKSKEVQLLSTKLVILGYLQYGIFQSVSGFLQWFIILNDFGIPFGQVTMLNSKVGVVPERGDSYDPNSPWLGNSNLQSLYLQNGGSCSAEKTNYQTVDWLYSHHDYVDLRQMIVYCGSDGNYHENVNWGPCRVNQISPIMNRPVCYSTELNKYGQAGFFYGLVVNQYVSYFVVQALKVNFSKQGINNFNIRIYIGFYLNFLILSCLIYFETFHQTFGFRDLIFEHNGVCAIPLGLTMLILSETKKLINRNSQKIYQSIVIHRK